MSGIRILPIGRNNSSHSVCAQLEPNPDGSAFIVEHTYYSTCIQMDNYSPTGDGPIRTSHPSIDNGNGLVYVYSVAHFE